MSAASHKRSLFAFFLRSTKPAGQHSSEAVRIQESLGLRPGSSSRPFFKKKTHLYFGSREKHTSIKATDDPAQQRGAQQSSVTNERMGRISSSWIQINWIRGWGEWTTFCSLLGDFLLDLSPSPPTCHLPNDSWNLSYCAGIRSQTREVCFSRIWSPSVMWLYLGPCGSCRTWPNMPAPYSRSWKTTSHPPACGSAGCSGRFTNFSRAAPSWTRSRRQCVSIRCGTRRGARGGTLHHAPSESVPQWWRRYECEVDTGSRQRHVCQSNLGESEDERGLWDFLLQLCWHEFAGVGKHAVLPPSLPTLRGVWQPGSSC